MDIHQLEETLRDKIAQARKNGFDVVPMGHGTYGFEPENQKCCIVWALSDLNNPTPKIGIDGGALEYGFENRERLSWHDLATYQVGQKFRRECLAYMKRKERRLARKLSSPIPV